VCGVAVFWGSIQVCCGVLHPAGRIFSETQPFPLLSKGSQIGGWDRVFVPCFCFSLSILGQCCVWGIPSVLGWFFCGPRLHFMEVGLSGGTPPQNQKFSHQTPNQRPPMLPIPCRHLLDVVLPLPNPHLLHTPFLACTPESLCHLFTWMDFGCKCDLNNSLTNLMIDNS
jgi:hypothetical protein